jgi:hypothetical protein
MHLLSTCCGLAHQNLSVTNDLPAVLDRVRGFIPSIQAANAQLQQQLQVCVGTGININISVNMVCTDPGMLTPHLQSTAAEELNIENVDEQGTGDVIEMVSR